MKLLFILPTLIVKVVYSTNPNSKDTDNDGLTDFDEIVVYSTNPNSKDTDNDRIFDNYEIYSGLNPLIDDANDDLDNDGLTNFEEFNLGTFANSTDTDSDSMDDLWEVQTGTNPKRDDSNDDLDKDDLSNLEEYNLGTFANTSDTDSDGIYDGYEVYSGLDPLTDDSNDDLDNDGLTNFEEFKMGTFANNSDTDNDGLTDYEEIKIYKTSPIRVDTDNDGLTDYEEIKIYGTNPKDNDTDGDGEEDGKEVENGFDPLNPKSNLALKLKVKKIIITILISAGVVIFIAGLAFSIFIGIKLNINKKTKKLGFSSYKEMLKAKSLGFRDKSEWKEINAQGYKTKSEYLEALKREEDYKILIDLLNKFKPNISVNLQRISELSGLPKTVVEEYIKDILRSNPDIGEYYELEQSFIRKETIDIDNEIDKLLNQYRSWEAVGEGKKKE